MNQSNLDIEQNQKQTTYELQLVSNWDRSWSYIAGLYYFQDENEQLRVGMRATLTTLGMINFPLMVGLAVVAKPLVLTLFSERWEPSVEYFQLLCAVGLLYPINLINLNLVLGKGRSDLYLRLAIIRQALVVINLAITWQIGINAMIIIKIAPASVIRVITKSKCSDVCVPGRTPGINPPCFFIFSATSTGLKTIAV